MKTLGIKPPSLKLFRHLELKRRKMKRRIPHQHGKMGIRKRREKTRMMKRLEKTKSTRRTRNAKKKRDIERMRRIERTRSKEEMRSIGRMRRKKNQIRKDLAMREKRVITKERDLDQEKEIRKEKKPRIRTRTPGVSRNRTRTVSTFLQIGVLRCLILLKSLHFFQI